MRVVSLKEAVPRGGRINFHHLTDLHVGAPDLAEQELRDRIELIRRDPCARWGMGGDSGELINHNDPRYEPSSIHPRYRQATDLRGATKEHLVELFEPITGKCWYWADGNHERTVDKWFGGHFGVETCCELGIEARYVDYRGLVRIVLEAAGGARLGLLIDVQHGWQTGRLKGAPHVQAERELGMTDADIVVRGHNHSPMAHQFQTLGATHPGRTGRARIVERTRTVINGGCWRKGYIVHEPINPRKISETEKASWAETKGYRVEALGGPVVVLRPDYGQGRKIETDRVGLRDGRPASIAHTVIEGLPTVTEDAAALLGIPA